ncbi:SGNH/GDSL hydrolase family protein [Pontibacter qinzhouensis]|uniref:SGNH/GDSL hydrolase family protein n=1 Tax=Pontibacter qinzhouensis TaxID=2603253 RepID=UPI001650ADF9|nr:T9SS type A sorting domain-containing protein [Pontibacter qinzhouensis]
MALQPPTGVQALTSLAGSITLRWAAAGNQEITSYSIEVAATENGTYMTLASVPNARTSYRHTGLAPKQTLFYRIRSFDGDNYSAYSPVVSATTRPADFVYKIMPLGDSNTEGHDKTTNNTEIPMEYRASYRSELSKLLTDAKINFDFVGSRKSGSELVEDDDHAGFPGLGNGHIASILRTGSYTTGGNTVPVTDRAYLDIYNPDIILLHTGTNGVSGDEEGMNSLSAILDEIDYYEARAGKEVTVIVSKIILRVCSGPLDWECPNRGGNEITIEYNNRMGPMVADRIAMGDRLVLVDMADAKLDYTYASSLSNGDMADFLHPVQKGYDKMSMVWHNALVSELVFGTFPVELASFEARPTSQGIALHWRTASEKDNSHFVVQRMKDQDQFVDVGSVAGSGTSSITKNYTFTDTQAPVGTLYYRLKQVDFNGAFSFSKVVPVANMQKVKQADQLYPNPADGRTVHIEAYGFVPEEQLTLFVFNSSGKAVGQLKGSSDGAGTLDSDLNFQEALAPGLYYLTVAGTNKTRSLKFVVK